MLKNGIDFGADQSLEAADFVRSPPSIHPDLSGNQSTFQVENGIVSSMGTF